MQKRKGSYQKKDGGKDIAIRKGIHMGGKIKDCFTILWEGKRVTVREEKGKVRDSPPTQGFSRTGNKKKKNRMLRKKHGSYLRSPEKTVGRSNSQSIRGAGKEGKRNRTRS